MKLSIIIPFHKTIELTKELLNVLTPQLTEECELIIVDDDKDTFTLDRYSSDNVRIIHNLSGNGTASVPRNVGLDNCKGENITFIDSDDMVSDNYIVKILDKIKTTEFDYCLFSWKYKDGKEIIIKEDAPDWNYSCWNCIYKREIIGDTRFDETIKIGEDGVFNSKTRKGKRANIEDVLYIYNSGREGSLTN